MIKMLIMPERESVKESNTSTDRQHVVVICWYC